MIQYVFTIIFYYLITLLCLQDFINDLFRSCDASNQLIQSPSEVSPIFQTTPTSTNSPFDHVTDTGISYDILQSSPSGSEGGYNSAEFVPSGPDNYSPNHLMSTSGWYPYDNETYTDMVTSSRDVHIDVGKEKHSVYKDNLYVCIHFVIV